jgi:hypothetical protein
MGAVTQVDSISYFRKWAHETGNEFDVKAANDAGEGVVLVTALDSYGPNKEYHVLAEWEAKR